MVAFKNLVLNILRVLPDKLYLKLLFYKKVGTRLNLTAPKTFNEKVQWLKINDRNPLYNTLVDKLAVREYVRESIGESFLVPLLGIWSDANKIDFNQLPNEFVLKCTHDSGSYIVCINKENLDKAKARKKLTSAMRFNFFWKGREWPYRAIEPKIIAEAYIGEPNCDIVDYKFFCFHGEPKCILVCTNRHSGKRMTCTFFDMNWNRLPFYRYYLADSRQTEKPAQLGAMITLARKLSSGLTLSRIDLYEVNSKIYFGEITLSPGSGLEPFEPVEWDVAFGSWINLDGRAEAK